ELLLLGANIVAQVKIDVALKFIYLVAKGRQSFLQRDACIARELPVVLGPRRLDQAATVDAVGQMTDGNRVGIGVVVLLQDVEIFSDDESRSIGATREKQNSLAGGRIRLPIRTAYTKRFPFREVCATAHIVETFRHSYFEAPGQRGLPFTLAQVVGRRSKHVRYVGPNIGAPVTREIDRKVDEVRRHELRLPHAACP